MRYGTDQGERGSPRFYIPSCRFCRTGVEQSGIIFGADEAYSINTLSNALSLLLKHVDHLYVDVPAHIHSSEIKRGRKNLISYLTGTKSTPEETILREIIENRKPQSLTKEVMKLRRIKSVAERAVMRKAGDVSGTAHAKVIILSFHLQTNHI